MNGLYHYPPTWLHKLPAAIKLIVLAVLSVLIMRIEAAAYLFAALTFIALFYFSFGLAAARRIWFLKPLWPIMLMIFLAQFYATGLEAACASIARLVLMVLLADLVTMSTPMQGMMDAISLALSPLRVTGLDSRRLSFCVALAIRFVPVLLETWHRQCESWRARTGRRPHWKLIAPFLGNVLRIADRTAESLDARGFGMQHKSAHQDINR